VIAFLGNILGIYIFKFQKKSSKISLYYFVKVCVKNLTKICHFQSFQVHLQVYLLFKSSGYKSFYTIFEGSNVNEIIPYCKNLSNKILDLIMCKNFSLF